MKHYRVMRDAGVHLGFVYREEWDQCESRSDSSRRKQQGTRHAKHSSAVWLIEAKPQPVVGKPSLPPRSSYQVVTLRGFQLDGEVSPMVCDPPVPLFHHKDQRGGAYSLQPKPKEYGYFSD